MNNAPETVRLQLGRQRRSLLRRISRVLDVPMTVLSLVWLVLLVVEFTSGLNPALELMGYVIWMLFVLHFALEFWIAPEKLVYLRRNWLTALALVLPAFRALRVFRAFRLLRTARVGRGMRLVRWITSLNRGMKATQRSTAGRGLRYVVALTLLVNFTGAAGIFYFENPPALRRAGYQTSELPAAGIRSYGESLWWTAMMLTTMGSDYFPKSTEGRVIALLLAIYGFAIFGYITATVASLIIRVEQSDKRLKATDSSLESIDGLRMEIARLRLEFARAVADLQQLAGRLPHKT